LPPGTRIVQPALTADGDVLLHDGEGNSMRRVAVARGPGGWTVEERWTSFGLNPYFSSAPQFQRFNTIANLGQRLTGAFCRSPSISVALSCGAFARSP
jgi:hypothetical protein